VTASHEISGLEIYSPASSIAKKPAHKKEVQSLQVKRLFKTVRKTDPAMISDESPPPNLSWIKILVCDGTTGNELSDPMADVL